MKIEVTFDRTAKQQFKDQCIKRLRKFVEDIKKQQPDYKGQLVTNTRYQQYQDKFSGQQLAGLLSKKCWGEQNSARGVSTLANSECMESRENSRELFRLAKASKINHQGIEQYRSDRLNLRDMRDNVDRIMTKLEHTSRKQANQHQELRNQIVQTNHKVDQLIVYLQNRNLLRQDHVGKVGKIFSPEDIKQVKTQYDDGESLTGSLSENFELKFNQLVDRYAQLNKRAHDSNNVKGNKSYFSFESTTDSMTFRHN